jgi:hypothetical protein
MPIIVKTDGTYFTEESNPFGGDSFWKPGTYANGGSWLRQQCIACTGNPADSAPHRVFGWNVFVLAVLAWLGWRKGAG